MEVVIFILIALVSGGVLVVVLSRTPPSASLPKIQLHNTAALPVAPRVPTISPPVANSPATVEGRVQLSDLGATAVLTISKGPAQDKTIWLNRDVVLLERHPASMLVNDHLLSRRHASLEQINARWFIRDLGSANGTFLDGKPLRPHHAYPLTPGAELRFGASLARFDPVTPRPTAEKTPAGTSGAGLTILSATPVARRAGIKLGPQFRFEPHPLRGGFALVYKGVDQRTGQVVALKVLPDYGTQSEQIVQRFEREGRLQLDHPHITKTFDYGTARVPFSTDQSPYILMEWVAGGTLRARMLKTLYARQPREVIRVVQGICSALDYAHHGPRKIVHRDIKPENIMFTDTGVVKVVDFGVASIQDEVRVTEVGTKIGTPTYMAPEQARGELIDFRADIYAIGVISYELLTQQRLFTGSPYEVMEHHMGTPPTPPCVVNPQLPAAVDQVLLKALAKPPGQRYNRAGDFARDLERALHG